MPAWHSIRASANKNMKKIPNQRPQPIKRKGVAMTASLKPLADRVIVKALEEKEKKRGGIIIPDTAKEKPQEGEVIAVGPGKFSETGERIKPEVKKGDKVLYG